MFRRLLDRLHAIVEVERLARALVLAQRASRRDSSYSADVCSDRAAALRGRLDDADVAQPGEGHVQGPGIGVG